MKYFSTYPRKKVMLAKVALDNLKRNAKIIAKPNTHPTSIVKVTGEAKGKQSTIRIPKVK